MRVNARCPKCGGGLFADYSPGDVAPDLACLACGWRRVVTRAEVGVGAPNADLCPQVAGGR